MKLRDVPVGLRIQSIVVLAILGLAAASAISLLNLHAAMLGDREVQTQRIVETAVSLVQHYADEAKAGRLSQRDAQQAAMLVIGFQHSRNAA